MRKVRNYIAIILVFAIVFISGCYENENNSYESVDSTIESGNSSTSEVDLLKQDGIIRDAKQVNFPDIRSMWNSFSYDNAIYYVIAKPGDDDPEMSVLSLCRLSPRDNAHKHLNDANAPRYAAEGSFVMGSYYFDVSSVSNEENVIYRINLITGEKNDLIMLSPNEVVSFYPLTESNLAIRLSSRIINYDVNEGAYKEIYNTAESDMVIYSASENDGLLYVYTVDSKDFTKQNIDIINDGGEVIGSLDVPNEVITAFEGKKLRWFKVFEDYVYFNFFQSSSFLYKLENSSLEEIPLEHDYFLLSNIEKLHDLNKFEYVYFMDQNFYYAFNIATAEFHKLSFDLDASYTMYDYFSPDSSGNVLMSLINKTTDEKRYFYILADTIVDSIID